MTDWQDVSEAEFYAWIDRYPRPLRGSVSPHGYFTDVGFYDFTLGDARTACVAAVNYGEAKDQPNGEKPVRWCIKVSVQPKDPTNDH